MFTLLELLQAPHNIVYAVLILVAIGFWLITVLGFISSSALDGIFELGVDVDLDHEVDMDHSPDMDLHAVGFVTSVLSFMGVGKVPVTFIVTLLMVVFGAFGITFNYWLLRLDLVPEAWLSLCMLVGGVLCFVTALYATAFMVRPLYPVFQDYGSAIKSEGLVGKTASITSGRATLDFGQASIKLDGGDHVSVTVRSTTETELQYGERVLVVDYDQERNVYFVEPYYDSLSE